MRLTNMSSRKHEMDKITGELRINDYINNSFRIAIQQQKNQNLKEINGNPSSNSVIH